MSTEKKFGLSKKNESVFSVLALIFGLVAGIVVWQLTDKTALVVLYTIILVFGAYFLVSMMFANNESDFIPSQRSFRLVWGALLTTVGALLLVSVYSKIELWVAAVILLIVVAVVILVVYMSKGQEGK